MKEKKKILSQYKRKIHIDGEEWTYNIVSTMFKDGHLKVCNPSRTKKYSIRLGQIGNSHSFDELHWCPEEFDGEDDEVFQVSITPSIVKQIITDTIIKGNK